MTATHSGESMKAAVVIAAVFLADLAAFAADPGDPSQTGPWPDIEVVAIRIEPCALRFKATMELPNGVRTFSINPGDLNRTFFFGMGDVSEDIEVLRYIPRVETREVDGVLESKDVSILEIRFRGDTIRLRKGRECRCDTPYALLRIPGVDGETEVAEGDRIDVGERRFTVRRIEPWWSRVLLVDDASGARCWFYSDARWEWPPPSAFESSEDPHADGEAAVPPKSEKRESSRSREGPRPRGPTSPPKGPPEGGTTNGGRRSNGGRL